MEVRQKKTVRLSAVLKEALSSVSPHIIASNTGLAVGTIYNARKEGIVTKFTSECLEDYFYTERFQTTRQNYAIYLEMKETLLNARLGYK